MKLPHLLSLALLALTLAAPAARAGDSLTREQVRSLAISQSNTLKRALLSVDSALLEEKLQFYSRLPSLLANAGAGLSYPQASLPGSLGASAGITVSQTIYSGGKSALVAAIDSLSTQAARQQARSEYFTVLQKADDAFSAVIEAQSSVAAAGGDLQAARTHQNLAEAMLEAGITTRASYLKTEAETAAAETSLTEAQGLLSVAYARLSALTGRPLPMNLEGADTDSIVELRRQLAGFSSSQTEALITGVRSVVSANNPSLTQASLAREQARSSFQLAKTDYLPRLSAGWSNTWRYSGGRGLGTGSLSISASIPLDFWVTKAGADSKDIAVRQADLDLGETRRSLDLEVQGTVYDLISSSRAVSSSSKALDYAESHYEGVLEQFRLSAASSSDLSDAQALVSTSRKLLISARARFLTNLSALRTLAGLQTDDLLLRIMP